MFFFGRDDISFVAIDGTCRAEETTEFLLFYAGAYGARGSLNFNDTPPVLKYSKWSLEQDVSVVAQVPIPYAELQDILENEDKRDPFAVSDTEKINLSGLHTQLMQLSEIYLAYDTATSSRTDAPNFILLDNSISSSMASNIVRPDAVRMIGSYWQGRKLKLSDILIAFSHPYNDELNVPTCKKFRQETGLLKALEKGGGVVNIETLAQSEGLEIEDFQGGIRYLTSRNFAVYDELSKNLQWTEEETIDRSWHYTQNLFKSLCEKLFVEKDPTALTYQIEREEVRQQRWMSPVDVKFLIGVGLRMLIEECWKRNILLVGLVKDSSSAYFTRNYLGVMRFQNIYSNLRNFKLNLPSTDRIALEILPLLDESIESPWSTIEFDSIFMTMHVKKNEDGSSNLSGVMGDILSPERLTARSLAQFYVNRKPSGPLMGHVIFVERLLYPQWDKNARLSPKITTHEFGNVSPYFRENSAEYNIGQTIVMYLLKELTRNHFTEVIGYPDPLHKADWGAKTVGRRLADMLQSVEYMMRARPLIKTFRKIRDSVKR